MAPTESHMERLAESLPDVPRYLYVRSMLLSGRCEVIGLEETRSGPCFVARELEEREDRWFCVVGRPPVEAIREAARRNGGGEAIAVPEDAPHVLGSLLGWTVSRVTLHVLGDVPRPPWSAAGEVKPFGPSNLYTVVDDLPEVLRSYFESAMKRRVSVAAAMVGGFPVSFCCAEDESETLWDISIETLEHHRAKGHAARCVSWLIAEMRGRGKEPVWAAEEDNPASLGLAAKLGFVPADEMILFSPGDEGHEDVDAPE